MIDISEISNEKLTVIVSAAVETALKEGGYVSVDIVGQMTAITISKLPMEVSHEGTVD